MDASNGIFTPSPAEVAAAEPVLPLYKSGAPPPYTPPSNPAVLRSSTLKPYPAEEAIPLPTQGSWSNRKKSYLCIGVAALILIVTPLIIFGAVGYASHQNHDAQAAQFSGVTSTDGGSNERPGTGSNAERSIVVSG